jgi:hypothetical protein
LVIFSASQAHFASIGNPLEIIAIPENVYGRGARVNAREPLQNNVKNAAASLSNAGTLLAR